MVYGCCSGEGQGKLACGTATLGTGSGHGTSDSHSACIFFYPVFYTLFFIDFRYECTFGFSESMFQ